MEVNALGPGQTALTPAEEQAVAEAEAAFAEAVGSVVVSMAMNSMGVLTETLGEIGKDE